MTRYFKVVNKEGLFSTGGMEPRFNKRGKVWTSIGALKNHLNQFRDSHYWTPHNSEIRDWKVVEFELRPVGDAPINISAFIEESRARKSKEDRVWKESNRRYRVQQLRKELSELENGS